MPRSRLILLLSAMLILSACATRTPEADIGLVATSALPPMQVATATVTPTPSLTPTATRVPHCPAPDLNAVWTPPVDFAAYPQAIEAFLNGGGTAAALSTLLTDASSINASFGGVFSFDLTGDGEPETVVSIIDPAVAHLGPVPSGDLLIYGCVSGAAPLLFRDASLSASPLLQVYQIVDAIGAGHAGQVATLRSECGAHTCFDTLDVLGWDGVTFSSLMSSRLQMPHPTYALVNDDADAALEIAAVSGAIASVGAGPPRALTQKWDWNGAQFVLIEEELVLPRYRIHLIHDADDQLLGADLTGALASYERAITDDTLLDWQVELGVARPVDRAHLSAYALYRIMLLHVRSGNVDQARVAFENLSATYPAGEVGSIYQTLAGVFWSNYTATGNLTAACNAANRHANNDTDALDGLNAFGYANREYVARDMCPFVVP